MRTNEDRMDELVEDIARYLTDHPNAADTVDGVLLWWLARQRYAHDAARVVEALNRLVAASRIVKSTQADGTILYRKRPDRDEANY